MDMKLFRQQALKSKPGFTLLEILVSVVILAIGCLVVISMQTSTMEGGARAHSLTTASFLAESEVERFKALSRGELLALSSDPVFLTREGRRCTPPSRDTCYERSFIITEDYPTSNSVGVSMKVAPPRLAGGGPLIYDTFITYMNFSK